MRGPPPPRNAPRPASRPPECRAEPASNLRCAGQRRAPFLLGSAKPRRPLPRAWGRLSPCHGMRRRWPRSEAGLLTWGGGSARDRHFSRSGSETGSRCSPGLGGGRPETWAGPAWGPGDCGPVPGRAPFPCSLSGAPRPGGEVTATEWDGERRPDVRSGPAGPFGWDVRLEDATGHRLFSVPHCLRLVAGSCHLSPRAYSRVLAGKESKPTPGHGLG